MLRSATCVARLFRTYWLLNAPLVAERAPRLTLTERISFSLSPVGAGTVGTADWFTGAGVVPSAKLYANWRFSTVSATGCGALKFTSRMSMGCVGSAAAFRKYVIIQMRVHEVEG